ncbi:apolipoprotein F [Oryctolagus cuniculus]|uniref:apolipoprotein F n=1 Tax=Oryctolagus cuniculus TaxID=9986 RepID=UPI002230A1CE|nr:apolipoprotein F [Oryctolagus cuniculus]
MIRVVSLLCCVLLSPVAAFPRNAQNGALTSPPSVTENGPQPSTLPRRNPLPDPRACQDLLHMVPSLAPLPEHLSKIALRVALEEAGCLAEARNLQLQLTRMGAKDITETLIQQSQERREGGGISSTQVILRDLGGSPGELRRARRSAPLPEACSSRYGWVLHDTSELIAEFAEKLPATELAAKLKTAALNVTQKCTQESWEQLEEVLKELIRSPEVRNYTMPLEEQTGFAIRIMYMWKRFIVDMIKEFFQTYFG